MRVLLYEYLTGGGLLSERSSSRPGESMLAEGRAMVQALSADLARISGLKLFRLEDARQSPLDAPAYRSIVVSSGQEEAIELRRWSERVNGVILIAPETGGRLLLRCRLVTTARGRLLSPEPKFVELTTDKAATAERLNRVGVATPRAAQLDARRELPARFPFPAVIKPIDGAGSEHTRLLKTATALADVPPDQFPLRLEQFCPGTAASVSALCGPHGPTWLPACRQHIQNHRPDGRFQYVGGSLPLASALAERATCLAAAALAALPLTTGYVGVDLILGADPSGGEDVVLDVNPRLTTSYVGLRQAARENLAAAMMDIAAGVDRSLSFSSRMIQFRADGQFVTSGET